MRQLDVAGTYTGPVTGEVTLQPGLTIPVDGSMRVLAEQDAEEVTLSGSFTIGGVTETIDASHGTIDDTGLWTEVGDVSGGFLFGADYCGYAGEDRVRFSEGTLRMEFSATVLTPTIDCPNMSVSAVLTRT